MYYSSNKYSGKIALPWVNQSLKSICLALQECTVEMQWKYNDVRAAPARMRVNDSQIKKRISFYSDLKLA